MDKGLQKEVELFREEAIWLQNCQIIASRLFDASDETTALLRNTADLFFRDLSIIMVDYLILLIGRITDSAQFGKNSNLSVNYITNSLADKGLANVQIEELTQKLNGYRAEHLNDARNKIVSHADKTTLLAGKTLGAHPKEEALNFFSNLQSYCDEVGKAVGIGPLDFSVQAGKGDVFDLLKVLERAQALKTAKDK